MGASSTDKLLTAIGHLGFLSGVGYFFAPMIIWLLKKDESPFVAHHAKQAMVYQGATFVLMSILGMVGVTMSFLTAGLGFLLFIPGIALVSLLLLIPSLIATVKAMGDEHYSYPISGSWAENL